MDLEHPQKNNNLFVLCFYSYYLGSTFRPFASFWLSLFVEFSNEKGRFLLKSTLICLRLSFTFFKANSVTSGIVQTGIVLLCNLSGNTVFDQQLQYHEGKIRLKSDISNMFLHCL